MPYLARQSSLVRSRGLPLLLLVGCLGLAQAAEASEVVKLARLVMTGKRLSGDPLPGTAGVARIEQLPSVLVQGRRSEPMPPSVPLQLAVQRRGLPRAL